MFNETTSYLGNDADGCPPGYYRRIGTNDPRYPCIIDPSTPKPIVQGIDPCPHTPEEIISLGPCAPGYIREACYGTCIADPNWRAPAGTEGDYVNVNGTLVRKSLFQGPFGSGAPVDSGMFSGIDSTTLLLLGGLALFAFLKK